MVTRAAASLPQKHQYDRKLSPSERKEIALAFGWRDVSIWSRTKLAIGDRPLFDGSGKHYAWLVDVHVPDYDYDTLRFVRAAAKVPAKSNPSKEKP